MTDNRIEVSSVSDSRIARYSSDSIKKSLNLAKKLSNPEKDDNYYFNLGVVEYKQQSYETALHYFDRTIKINFKYIDAYFYRGYCNQSLGYYQEGITDFSQFINLTHTANTNAYYWRAVSRYKLGDYQGAVDDYTKVTQDYYWTSALAEYSGEHQEEAIAACHQIIAICNQIIAIAPNRTKAYFDRAVAKGRIGDKSGEMTDYNQIISICSQNIAINNNTDAYLERARAKKLLQDYHGAIADYNQVIEIDPDNIQAYFNRARSKDDLTDYQGAVSDYSQIIEIEPDNLEAYLEQARVKHWKIKDYYGAIDVYTQIITIDPHNIQSYYIQAYLERAFAKNSLEDYYGAIDDYTQIITIDPYNISAYLERASTKNSLENYQGAIADCDLAISKLTPDNDYLMEELLELRNEAMEQLDLGVE